MRAFFRAELKRQTESTNRMERKAKDLKNMLETSARRIQELSEERAMMEGLRSNEGDRQKNTKEIAVVSPALELGCRSPRRTDVI